MKRRWTDVALRMRMIPEWHWQQPIRTEARWLMRLVGPVASI
jgi:hypothetical protein